MTSLSYLFSLMMSVMTLIMPPLVPPRLNIDEGPLNISICEILFKSILFI